jgi:hypothetical protein
MPTPPEPIEALAVGPETDTTPATADQGRGGVESRTIRTRAPRRRSAEGSGPGRGRKLVLPDAVFERLQLSAIRKRSTVSAVAAEILDRNLPRLRIEAD